MDILTMLGIVIGLGAIIGGNLLEGGHTHSLVQLTAFVIVMGGTLGAVMVQTQFRTFVRALHMVKWAIRPPALDYQGLVDQVVNWSRVARKEGLLGLESLSEQEADSFARKGLQLLVDGSEPDSIRQILTVELYSKQQQDMQAARVFEAFGGYAPTIGIIGAVMGLIHVMNNLVDPSKLGPGIAVAFVATIYGVGFANLVFLPIANKLKTLIHNQVHFREMVIEGVLSIAEGENPRNIETKLEGYFSPGLQPGQ